MNKIQQKTYAPKTRSPPERQRIACDATAAYGRHLHLTPQSHRLPYRSHYHRRWSPLRCVEWNRLALCTASSQRNCSRTAAARSMRGPVSSSSHVLYRDCVKCLIFAVASAKRTKCTNTHFPVPVRWSLCLLCVPQTAMFLARWSILCDIMFMRVPL